MASANRGVLALALSLLFLFSGPLSQFLLPESASFEFEPDSASFSGSTDSTKVLIPGQNLPGIGPLLEMDPSHALQTLSFSVAASNDSIATGFEWNDWNLPGFEKQGLKVVDDGSLILGFQGVNWKPDVPGMQRIEVTLGETTDKSEFVDVSPIKERGFLDDEIGATNPWILGTTITMICIGLIFVLFWMRVATVKQGESEFEWEYEEEEFEDED